MKKEIEKYLKGINCSITEIKKDVFRITFINDTDIARIFQFKEDFEQNFFYQCFLIQYDTLEVRQ